MAGSHRPRISVIMAVYNCEDYVGEAIESVLAQSCEDWELICVDDASKDGSTEIVRGYADADERIRPVQNVRNIGAPGTRNVALEHARGDFIAVLDSDDISTPHRLELSLAAFDDDDELGVVTGLGELIDGDGSVITAAHGRGLGDEAIRHSLLEGRNRLFHSSAMIRVELMKRVGGYDEELPAAQDFDLFLRLLPHCRFRRLDDVILRYRYRKGSISQDKALAQRLYADFAVRRAQARDRSEPFDEQKELDEIARLLSPDHGRSPKAARHLNDAALFALYCGEPARARQMLRSARQYRPLSPRVWLSWMLTYTPPQLVSLVRDLRQGLLRRRG